MPKAHCYEHLEFHSDCNACNDALQSDPETILRQIQGSIARFDNDTRHTVEMYARAFRILGEGDPRALIAIALIGAETAAKGE